MKLRLLAVFTILLLIAMLLLERWLDDRPFAETTLAAPDPSSLETLDVTFTGQTAEVTEHSLALREESSPAPSLGENGTPTPMVTEKNPLSTIFSRTTNILLVGLDRRPGITRGGRPDTIVIAALSRKSGHLGLISVPRDLYVNIPGRGMDRINATFVAAWQQKTRPLPLLARVLEDTLQVPIHHSLALDLGGFEALVDALGGIKAYVPCPIVDDFIDPRSKTGRSLLDVEAGMQDFDGRTAALYARSRHGRSDWSRARRQQALLFGIKSKFATIDGLRHLPEFWSTLKGLIQSDMSRADFLRLVHQASHVETRKVHGLVLGVHQASPYTTKTGRAVLLPHPEEIRLALSRLFSETSPGTLPKGARCFAKNAALRASLNKH